MKILALADVHGNENALYKASDWIRKHRPDAVVLAGDITHFGPEAWAERFVRALVDQDVTVLGVPGNCDPPEVSSAIERGGGISLHEKRVKVGSVVFAGVGGSNPTPFPTLYSRGEEELRTAVEGLLKDVDVFVSHAPPWGKNDVAHRVGGHTGSKELARLLEEWRPKVVVTGHIHEARGVQEEDGIVYINPGKAGAGNGGWVEVEHGEKARAVLL